MLQAICLILFVMKNFVENTSGVYEFDVYLLMVLRFCNLATIFNLLTITLNEYVYIKIPLRYASIVRPKRVLVTVALGWLHSLVGCYCCIFYYCTLFVGKWFSATTCMALIGRYDSKYNARIARNEQQVF